MDATATTAQTVAPQGASSPSASMSVDFSPSQLQQMAQWEVEAGRMTREQADAMLKADSAHANTNTGPTSPDNPSSYAEPLAEDFGLPPLDLSDPVIASEHAAYTETPAVYDFHMPINGVDGGFVTEMQAVCKDMALPGFIAKYASGLYNRANEALRAGTLTNNDIEIAHNKAEFTLRQMWGDRYESNVRAAQSTIKHLPADKQARILEILTVTGMGNDPLLISHLANLAQHRAARKGK